MEDTHPPPKAGSGTTPISGDTPDATPGDTPDATPDPIAALLSTYPGGFAVNARGDVTANAEATQITSMAQLATLSRANKQVQFTLPGGQVIALMVRPLNGIETGEIEDMNVDSPMPPLKKGTGRDKGVNRSSVVDDYDFNDPKYRAAKAKFNRLQQAAIVSKGLLLEIEGETLEAKADYLAQNFPARIMDGIENAIRALSTDPIERAVFI